MESKIIYYFLTQKLSLHLYFRFVISESQVVFLLSGLGSRGEVVEVAPHKARKELLLPGLAVYASPENLEKYSKLLVDPSLDDQPSSPFALSVRNLSM